MSRRRVPLPSPAMAVALCALFVALGGASYALTIPRNSVGPNQLRTHAVTSTKLGTGAVTTRAIRDGAISGRKIGAGGVHASDLARGSVRSAALANGAVTGAKLAPNSVSATHLSLPVVSVEAFSAYCGTAWRICDLVSGRRVLSRQITRLSRRSVFADDMSRWILGGGGDRPR